MAKPNFFSSFDLDALKTKEKAVKAGVSTDEISLNELAHSGGWKIISQLITDIKSELDQTVINSMAAGLSYEEIGRTTVAVNITKDVLTRLVNKVDDAREAVERNRKD